MKNIVLILMDQLRYDFLGCYGAKHLKTPNIDRIASEGVRYEQAVSPSPLCIPARASLMTGRSALANRVTENSSWLRPDHDDMGIHTWAKHLNDKGYFTCAIGKMHFYPWDANEGFQERIIAEDKRHIGIKDDYTQFIENYGYTRMHGNEFEGYYEYQGAIINTLPDELQIDRFVSDKTCEKIEKLDKNNPFALMVGFPGPHCPYDPTQSMLDTLGDTMIPEPIPKNSDSETFLKDFVSSNMKGWNGVDYSNFSYENKMKIRKHYSALIESIDTYVGSIIDGLKEKDLYDDTVIIITSDHGDMMGDYDMLGKHYFYESSIRIPMIIKYPGVKPQVINETVSLTDLYGTICQFADIMHTDTVDATVMSPFGYNEQRPPIFGITDRGWMLRTDRYKYCIYTNSTELLHDLKNDPSEQNNLINSIEHEDIVKEMRMIMYQRIFKGIEEGNKDQVVRGPKLEAAFNDRGWKRAYPQHIDF